jgi:hypothetical protein
VEGRASPEGNSLEAWGLQTSTEENNVHALDATTGNEIWTRSLGKPVTRSALRCGNINPLGITGTPVIDEASGSIYLDANIADSSGPHHRLFALSLKDGLVLPGWPIDVTNALRTVQQPFNSRDQNQRGALTILAGMLYVPFGGHFGDCGDYRGWVVGVSLQDPRKVAGWSTRARGGGIWAPGGISVAGQSLFVATGNTFDASTWSDGEAVIRLAPDLHRWSEKYDFFAPPNWLALDRQDADTPAALPASISRSGRHPPAPSRARPRRAPSTQPSGSEYQCCGQSWRCNRRRPAAPYPSSAPARGARPRFGS